MSNQTSYEQIKVGALTFVPFSEASVYICTLMCVYIYI